MRIRQANSFVALMLLLHAILFAIGCSDRHTLDLSPLNPNAIVLALGDSLTYGTGTSTDEAYPAQLSTLIGHTVVNAGIPGEISSEGLSRLSTQLEEVNPELLILCHGGNDLLRRLDSESLYQNLKGMVKLAHRRNVEVLLIGVPSFSAFGLSVHPVYDRVAEELNVPYLRNALSDLLADPAMKSDQIHLNAEGYKRFATSIAQKIL